ncbi:ABC transporter ATP-binding protein [Azospirillum canadense]|uniref:ABC transporter ATP-binding protein n=1 Tax=Azospirillum canadense TaxID=403962 RepID=UPI002226B18F|nr:ABC transporter ATP-binding protein [Azospirillum canadense]MCW2240248.1 putative spermidine/putrescine transport system ATP-binding protein [Azospirillum canadense]
MPRAEGARQHGEFGEIRLDRVSRGFDGVMALQDLDLTIRRGEFIAFLGPSGCGKSTALNCVAGLLSLTGGSIWVDDRRIDELPPERRGFGMVFQNYALFPHMTVRKNIGFGLAMRGVPKAEAEARIDAAIRLVQLEAHGTKLPGQLSGGQQQRVAIARAIVVQPPLVLMDEPLSNLDARLRLEMRHEIRRIHQELGRSTVYVTHDQDEALSLADRIVVLREGRVRQIGTPEELYARPATLDVARFMGYRNVFEGELDHWQDGGQGERVAVRRHDLRVVGMPREALGSGRRAAVAIRPEDVLPGPEGEDAISGVVESVEFIGREYAATALTPTGLMLHFRSHQRLHLDEPVHLRAAPERVLVFAAEEGA